MIFLGRCFGGNGSGTSCLSDQRCAAIWSYEGLQRGCAKATSSQLVIITNINVVTREGMQTIIFLCNYDECNSDSVVLKGQAYIDQYYDISPLYKALGYNESMKVTKVTSTTISSTYSQNPEKSTTTPLSSTTESSSVADLSTTTTASGVEPSTTMMRKNCCSTYGSKSTVMVVALAAVLVLFTRHCFDLH